MALRFSFLLSSPFVSVGQPEHGRLIEVTRQYLQSDRQTRGGRSTRNAHTWDASQVAGDRKNVGQVHLDGVVHLFAELERRKGRDRTHDYIHLLEGLSVIAGDERSNLLRSEIVG